jgi:DNA-binding transcriptional ArsR family regulator
MYDYFGRFRNKDGRTTVDAVFKALSDVKRREILRLLRSGDLTAGEIAERFPVSRSTLSGHLAVLKDAGLVVTERQGTTIVYSLNLAVYEELIAAVMDLLGVNGRGAGRPGEDGAR